MKKKEEMEFDIDSQNGKEYITPMGKFLQLSQLLFNEDSDEWPYRMNELKKTNKFYDEAKKMAEELEIDWEKMTSEESNRIMLNLLGDAFMACKPQDDKGFPSIRKTDSYSIQQFTPKAFIEAQKALVAAEEEKERLALECKQAAEKIAVLEPKGRFYDTVTKRSGTISVAMASKILNFEGAGRNSLFRILYKQKMIDYNNMPYQKHIDKGMMVLGSQEFMKYDKPMLRYVPKITHKGLDYIMNLLIDLGYKQREEYVDFNPYDIDFSKLNCEEY